MSGIISKMRQISVKIVRNYVKNASKFRKNSPNFCQQSVKICRNFVKNCEICRGSLEFISKESRNFTFWAYLWRIFSEIGAFLAKFAEDPSSLFRKNHEILHFGRIK